MSTATLALRRLRTDAALVRRFRSGDDAAFDALHRRYAAQIHSYAQYMLRGSAHDPDDATQDVFLRAYQALRRDDRLVELRPWLFRIAHNRCIDALRGPRHDELDEDAAGACGVDLAAAVEERDAVRALLRDIGSLPESQRSALLLREVAGLPHHAVAEALGISQTASRMLVHRARSTLVEAARTRDASPREVSRRLGMIFAPGTVGLSRLVSIVRAAVPGGPAGGAAVAGTVTSGGGKLAVGFCCAVLATGALATVDRPHQHRRRAVPRHATATRRPALPPVGLVHPAPPAAALSPQPHATRQPSAAETQRTPAPASTPTASRRPTTVDLATVGGEAAPAPRKHATPAQTVDLAQLGDG